MTETGSRDGPHFRWGHCACDDDLIKLVRRIGQSVMSTIMSWPDAIVTGPTQASR